MKLQTKYFGEIDYEPSQALAFPNGLFGFEEERSFLLLPFEGSGGTMLCLQSTATGPLAFVLLDPFSLDGEYSPELSAAELEQFGAEDISKLCFYVLCAVKLVAIPLGLWVLLRGVLTHDLMLTTLILARAMPAATNSTILCYRYGRDGSLASGCVFLSTLLSLVTIPLVLTMLFAA